MLLCELCGSLLVDEWLDITADDRKWAFNGRMVCEKCFDAYHPDNFFSIPDESREADKW